MSNSSVTKKQMTVPHILREITAGKYPYKVLEECSESQLRAVIQELAKKASCDFLTGLPNRECFEEQANRVLNRLKRNEESGVLLFIDIDYFKKVNDEHGHDVGDKVLQTLAKIMDESFRPTDILARYGGEEFVAFLPDSEKNEILNSSAELFLRKVNEFQEEGIPSFTVSIGLVSTEQDGYSFSNLVKLADAAMYRAKQAGRNCIRSKHR